MQLGLVQRGDGINDFVVIACNYIIIKLIILISTIQSL